MDKILYELESFLKRQISRRKFFLFLFSGLLLFISENRFLKHAFAKSEESPGRKKKNIKGKHDLVVAEGSDPYQNTIKGIEAIGGMNQFVKKDAVVVIKPNIGWDRTPEQGANTDPHVVAALVELCYTAGAKRVNVFDVTCDEAKRCYDNSGIRKAAEAKGAKVYFADHWNVVKAKFPYESSMADWKVLRDAVECDTFINVPVLKHHGLTGLTLSMKNLMGVCSGIRGMMHMGIGRKLADLTDFISPDLTVIDATRVLTKHGPQGGNIADVIQVNKVIVSTDPVLADAYAASLMKKEPLSIPYISEAVARNLGSADLVKADVVNVKV